MQATGNPVFRSGTRKAGTVGVPLFDTEISIRPLGGGAPLPAGERGEVCIRGPQVMRGYPHRPGATAEAIDADGWFHTGDVGVPDEDGYLAIVESTEEMLLYKAYNVIRRADDAGTALTAASVMAAVNGRVTPYRRLRDVVFIDATPVSAAGKVLKRGLAARERVAGG